MAPFFDAMSGVKKLTKVHAVSDHTTLACHPSFSIYTIQGELQSWITQLYITA